jgi:hypothetical protein
VRTIDGLIAPNRSTTPAHSTQAALLTTRSTQASGMCTKANLVLNRQPLQLHSSSHLILPDQEQALTSFTYSTFRPPDTWPYLLLRIYVQSNVKQMVNVNHLPGVSVAQAAAYAMKSK